MCIHGFCLALDRVSIGIEAAYIKWKQYSGYCKVSNGIALCSIHHKAFDRGVIAFTNPSVSSCDWWVYS
nr:HNH endonuclease [Photobacterium angustum]